MLAACVGFVACSGADRASDIELIPLEAMGAAREAPGREAQVDSARWRMQQTLRGFRPLPPWMASKENPITDERVTLGRKLFEDPRLSRSGELSCASCHPLGSYGMDGLSVAKGHAGKRGTRNTPTVFNAAGHVGQFWDGRAPDVIEQAKGPFLNPSEMAMSSPEAVVAAIASVPAYRAAFVEAFPDDGDRALSFDNIARAIGAFERTLVTPSRWDRFVLGDPTALSAEEKAGFSKFVEIGCATCHKGTYVGGERYRVLGSMVPWPRAEDPGRFAVTGVPTDRHVFKVASLRNIDQTAPYFHDGSVARLPDAVRAMALHQLGLELAPGDVDILVAWLRSLTGPIPPELVGAAARPL